MGVYEIDKKGVGEPVFAHERGARLRREKRNENRVIPAG
jgi:hypothetical protein